MSLYVTNLRKKRRRSPKDQKPEAVNIKVDRRKTRDRRILPAKPVNNEEDAQKIWLTPGERTLIEDLYLLEDGEKKAD
jgi:hypothetical protein